MREGQFSQPGRRLMRISVTGSGDEYIVRHGDEAPVRVRSGRNGLRCECGRAGCAHVESLRLCGFLDGPQEMSQAA